MASISCIQPFALKTLSVKAGGQCCPFTALGLWLHGAGTHDNETTVGWWKDSATPQEKDYIKKYLNTTGKDISGDFMRESFKSVSRTAIVMLQVCTAFSASVYVRASEHLADRLPEGLRLKHLTNRHKESRLCSKHRDQS